jgi:hypothetical protein
MRLLSTYRRAFAYLPCIVHDVILSSLLVDKLNNNNRRFYIPNKAVVRFVYQIYCTGYPNELLYPRKEQNKIIED